MPRTDETSPSDREARKAAVRDERWELLDHLQALLEPAMAGLGLVFLGLLLLEYADTDLGFVDDTGIGWALQTIWVVFLAEFALRFLIAPAKLVFLRTNWLGAISLALPFLRPLRAFRAARALRSLSLVRLLGGINRGIRVLRSVTRGRQFAYVGLLVVLVMLAGAVGVLFFDRHIENATILTFGDALWWSAAMVTTINNEKYAVSPEARVLAILMRVFAVSVFGYITASIASYLIGVDREEPAGNGESEALREEIAALRTEIAALRERLEPTGDSRA